MQGDKEKGSGRNNINLSNVGKSVIIGGTMLVPGVSGGSMAMILGVYDQLITSVSSFMKNKRANALFLLTFAVGGMAGMFLFSKPILYLIGRFPMPMLYFFMGAVAGGIPLMLKKSKLRKFSVRGLAYVILGIVMVVAVAYIPIGGEDSSMGAGMKSFVLLAAAGFIAAVALVLPGISVSYLLLVMGLYDETMRAISQLYMPFLIPLGIGLVLGIILTTKILEMAMRKYPQPTYLMILGFVLGSVREIYPGVPTGIEIPICVVAICAGFVAIMPISRRELMSEEQ